MYFITGNGFYFKSLITKKIKQADLQMTAHSIKLNFKCLLKSCLSVSASCVPAKPGIYSLSQVLP